jgi:hypothetical protein
VTPSFFDLPAADRRDVLEVVATESGLPPAIIEKDVWICWSLAEVFSNGAGVPMAFKGGTSLSKVFGAIDRFSEDLDITLGFMQSDDKLPESRNQRDKLSLRLRRLVAHHIDDAIIPALRAKLSLIGQDSTVVFDGADVVTVFYESCLTTAGGYVLPQVRLEFGGRNRITPSERHLVTTYIDSVGIELLTPSASVNVLSPIRTFWEKVTLAHAECSRSEWRHDGDRFARHWSDLAALANHPIGELALAHRAVLEDVVRIKTTFWSSAAANYEHCLVGRCRLLPSGELLDGLRRDYRAMVSAGMFAAPPPAFEVLLERIGDLEARINAEFTRRPGTD